MLTTRILSPDDFEQVAKLYRTNTQWMQTPVPPEFIEANLKLAQDEYLSDSNPDKVLIGVFDGDDLLLTGGMSFWAKLPFCTILRLVGSGGFTETRRFSRAMVSLFDAFLDILNSRACYRFYLLSSDQHLSTLARLGHMLPRLRQNYLMTVEEVIPPNCPAKFSYGQSMMGEKVWPTRLVIRAGTAYNHVRSFDHEAVSDDVLMAWSTENNATDRRQV